MSIFEGLQEVKQTLSEMNLGVAATAFEKARRVLDKRNAVDMEKMLDWLKEDRQKFDDLRADEPLEFGVFGPISPSMIERLCGDRWDAPEDKRRKRQPRKWPLPKVGKVKAHKREFLAVVALWKLMNIAGNPNSDPETLIKLVADAVAFTSRALANQRIGAERAVGGKRGADPLKEEAIKRFSALIQKHRETSGPGRLPRTQMINEIKAWALDEKPNYAFREKFHELLDDWYEIALHLNQS